MPVKNITIMENTNDFDQAKSNKVNGNARFPTVSSAPLCEFSDIEAINNAETTAPRPTLESRIPNGKASGAWQVNNPVCGLQMALTTGTALLPRTLSAKTGMRV